MKAYKGFDKNLQCRGFQYEIGGEYEESSAKLCENGFHACEYPMDVFGYYTPSDSRFCEVDIEPTDERQSDDTKICGKKIKIGAEIGILGIVKASVEYIVSRATKSGNKQSNTGNQSAATNTGDWSAAIVSGRESIACALGIEGKAKGALGCYIVLAEYILQIHGEWHLKEVKSHKVDGEIIKPDVFYMLKNGEFVEVEE